MNPRVAERIRKYKLIEDLFFRGLRSNESIVDNSCDYIAKELGFTVVYVSQALDRILRDKEETINKKR